MKEIHVESIQDKQVSLRDVIQTIIGWDDLVFIEGILGDLGIALESDIATNQLQETLITLEKWREIINIRKSPAQS